MLDVGLSDVYDQAPCCAFDLVAGLTPGRPAGHAGPSDVPRRTVRRVLCLRVLVPLVSFLVGVFKGTFCVSVCCALLGV